MMPNWLKKRAFLTPNRPAIIFKGQQSTFAELYDSFIEMAGKLTSIGVRKDNLLRSPTTKSS